MAYDLKKVTDVLSDSFSTGQQKFVDYLNPQDTFSLQKIWGR